MKFFDPPIEIDLRSGVPIYLQIVELIRQRVSNGALQSGDQLPTVRQLATELRINFNTVARAYRILDESGLISTQQGRGTFIWDPPSEEVMQKLRDRGLRELTQQYLREAARLAYSPAEVKTEFEQEWNAWQNESADWITKGLTSDEKED